MQGRTRASVITMIEKLYKTAVKNGGFDLFIGVDSTAKCNFEGC